MAVFFCTLVFGLRCMGDEFASGVFQKFIVGACNISVTISRVGCLTLKASLGKCGCTLALRSV